MSSYPQQNNGQVAQDLSQQGVAQPTNGMGNGPQLMSTADAVDVVCGPLLNYRHMSAQNTGNPVWHGSILIVTLPGQQPGQLRLSCVGAVGSNGPATDSQSNSQTSDFSPVRLYEDPLKAFFRYEINLPFQDQESTWEYTIPNLRAAPNATMKFDRFKRFYVPSKHESMRIMFHSCNGFSVGTDEEAWSGPAVWNDVMRIHNEKPFHVMIGGGDQIYNDSVRVSGPLKAWTAIGNPKKRRDYPFGEEMRKQCDDFYFDNYRKWYSTEPFASANGQIAQLNIWDDHDIIDGFGSYTDHFMKCAVFRGIGGVAHKYYMLFQHHLPPPPSTFTTDAPQTLHATNGTTAPDPAQLKDTFVMKATEEAPCFIVGKRPGPYVEERSRSLYCQLGKSIAFAGVDARTERTRHQINYPETYDQIFNHISEQLAASNGVIKHLILLLGVPIAYPRLQWLENILQSPLIGPIKFLNKRFGLAGSFFNQFDGKVDLLDDLDDHYTAHQHKKERKELIHRLQTISKTYSVRITILGGDVHLAALGRFYSNPKLKIAAEADWRYMPNVISSAITNKPPPQAVANLLAKRNKIHHLDHDTDETLLQLFDKDPGAGEPGVKAKTADSNHATMPSRNYAIISESHGWNDINGNAAAPAATLAPPNGAGTDSLVPPPTANSAKSFTPSINPREPLHFGEKDAGTTHPASSGVKRTGLGGPNGLDVTIRVEINPSDREGHTQGYGFSVPALEAGAYQGQGEKW